MDRDTYEVKYGEQAHARQHIAGSWSLDLAGTELAVDGWEGFMAVKEGPGLWALYFDVEGKPTYAILPQSHSKGVSILKAVKLTSF